MVGSCSLNGPLPDAVQDISVWKYPDVNVVDQDRVEVSNFLVAEKRVRHPDFARISQGKILQFALKY